MAVDDRRGQGTEVELRRSCAPGDVAALARLLEVARPGAWTEAALGAELGRGDARCAWLCAGGRAISVALGRIVLDELHVFDVATAPDRRRQGAGARVVGALLAIAEGAGCRAALLELRASNTAAEALYTGAGFVVVGKRPRYYPDGEDATLMTRTLEPGAPPRRPA